MHQSVWIYMAPMDNPGDSDSFLISHPGGYENGVHT